MNFSIGATWVQSARQELLGGWQRWTSFTCIWLWSCLAASVAYKNPAFNQLPGVLSCSNEVVLLAAATALLLILALSKTITSIVDSRFTMVLTGCFLTAGSLFFVLGTIFTSLALFVAGMVAGGIAIAVLKIAWGEMYSRMDLRRGLVSMGYALTSSMLIFLLAQLLPVFIQSLLLVMVALPCSGLIYKGTKRLQFDPASSASPMKPVSFSLSLLLLPAMVALSYGIIKGMTPWLVGIESSSAGSATSYAELLAGILIIVFSYSLGKRFGAAQIYACALIFVVAGLVFISSQTVPRWLAFFVHEVGFSIFYFFMVVYWGDLARRTGMSVVRIYTIGYCAFQVVQVFGSIVGYYVVGNQSANYALLVLLSVVLAFFVVALLLFSNAHSPLRQWLIANEVAETGDEIPVACLTISQQYKLSPREQEVLSLLARGRNASYVARSLCISPDTAKTHIKSIYRKVDVHTQQGLIDEIEKAIRE